MTFEQIPPPEHPAIRAARAIKEMHRETIAKIDAGFIFEHRDEHGEKVVCNEEMRAACMKQIILCDEIINRASTLSPELTEPVGLILTTKPVEEVNGDLPEIGNYDHKPE